MPDSLGVVVLAAGQGTRMKSRLHKVLHPLAGRPLDTTSYLRYLKSKFGELYGLTRA